MLIVNSAQKRDQQGTMRCIQQEVTADLSQRSLGIIRVWNPNAHVLDTESQVDGENT